MIPDQVRDEPESGSARSWWGTSNESSDGVDSVRVHKAVGQSGGLSVVVVAPGLVEEEWWPAEMETAADRLGSERSIASRGHGLGLGL
jgi:hypothetical protein